MFSLVEQFHMVYNRGNAVAPKRCGEFSGFLDRFGPVVVGLHRTTAAAAAGTDHCGARLTQSGRYTTASPSRRSSNHCDAAVQRIRIWAPFRHIACKIIQPKTSVDSALAASSQVGHRTAIIPYFALQEGLKCRAERR